ncbi:Transcriptional regulatory protein GlrR [Andreprevotia sp. IGB-42]|uniref:sigma-54 dependent transcriptional regulator n=1 Tax=Andreprevotia sp. IGB-42 TaxID=2497473 RepID=UPI0013596EDA|nr:sigma-54 dependent transcriptional regulator [Andreprevotia sp. IGB-42]KAF0813704.1 Transcriptional regulatory protein GlrR [Andreprevotia sp. IGB-42]
MASLSVALTVLSMESTVLPALRTAIADTRDLVLATLCQSCMPYQAQPLPEAELALIVVDAGSLPVATGLIARWRAEQATTPVLVVAEGLAGENLLGLLASGACDFLNVPFSQDELLARLRQAARSVQHARPAQNGLPAVPPWQGVARSKPQHRAGAGPRAPEPIGKSPAFLSQIERLARMAQSDARVLILGETGTGKEVCAQTIHYSSARAGGPWVAVNCGAIPQELIEDELFGHVRGAYTHAHAARTGLVREAEGGTLFLDEIDSLPLGAQAKLLRFLEDKHYRQVGANTLHHADVRVIAASNRCLKALVARGTFRQDLFFRLNVLALELPPLRERQEDIPLLARHFIEQACQDNGLPLPGLHPSTLRLLCDYEWPGNVRELKHLMERAVLLSSDDILFPDHLDLAQPAAAEDESFNLAKARAVERFERNYIERLLLASEGNITHAARIARKNRRAFFELIRKHQIDATLFRI